MMDRACALISHGDIGHGLDIDEIRAVAAFDAKAGDAVLRVDLLIAHITQEFGRGAVVAQSEHSGMEAADRMVDIDLARPWHAFVVTSFDQHEAIAVRASEIEAFFAEALVFLQPVDACAGEPLLPEFQRAGRNGKSRRADFAGAGTPTRDAGEGEIGHDGARCPGLVAIVEPQRIGEEGIVAHRVARQRRDVMQALDPFDHLSSPLGRFFPGTGPARSMKES